MCTIRAGERGTKRLVERFGDELLCVRYRYDAVKRERLTTVELVVDRTDWRPPTARGARLRLPEPPRWVKLRIAHEETELRQRVKAAGGRWRKDEKVWELPAGVVRKLGVGDRVVEPSAAD